MKDHNGCIRGYHRNSKAYYYRPELFRYIEVTFGMFDPEGGTSGEMTMAWEELNGKQCALLKSFEDSWSALALFTDVVQELGKIDSQLITEVQFCAILDKCGFKDLTKYEQS